MENQQLEERQHYPNPEVDECRILILKIVEQAVRDYLALEHAKTAAEQYTYQTAVGFLFDNEYCIQWGDDVKTLKELLEYVDIELEWFREQIIEQKKKRDREKDD